MSFPGRQHYTCALQHFSGEIKCILCDSTATELLETLNQPGTLPHVALPFVDFALYPFTAIK